MSLILLSGREDPQPEAAGGHAVHAHVAAVAVDARQAVVGQSRQEAAFAVLRKRGIFPHRLLRFLKPLDLDSWSTAGFHRDVAEQGDGAAALQERPARQINASRYTHLWTDTNKQMLR